MINMGYRMSIWPEGCRDTWVGDDHKLYAYQDFKNVEKSFTYLYEKSLCKMEEFNYIKDLFYPNPVEEAYGMFCCFGCSPEIVLTNEEFIEFTKLYLDDFRKARPCDVALSNNIEEYMNMMCKIKNNKILEWS